VVQLGGEKGEGRGIMHLVVGETIAEAPDDVLDGAERQAILEIQVIRRQVVLETPGGRDVMPLMT